MIQKIKQKLLNSMSVEELVASLNSRDTFEKKRVYDILLSECFAGVSFETLEERFSSLPSDKQQKFAKQAYKLKNSEFNTWLSNELAKNIQRKIYYDSKNEFDIAVAKIGLWQEKNRRKITHDISKIHEQALRIK